MHARLTVSGLIGGWKIDAKRRALLRLATNPDETAALLDDPVHGREPETTALALRARGEERFEDACADLGRHAVAGVGYGEHDVTAGDYRHVRVEVRTIDVDVDGRDRQL